MKKKITLTFKTFLTFWNIFNQIKKNLDRIDGTVIGTEHHHNLMLKSSFSEKPTKIWKNLPLVLMLLSKHNCFVKTGGRFFQILWPCLNFNNDLIWMLNLKFKHLMWGSCHIQSVLIGVKLWMFIYCLLLC